MQDNSKGWDSLLGLQSDRYPTILPIDLNLGNQKPYESKGVDIFSGSGVSDNILPKLKLEKKKKYYA
jgi:hypothetical protein